MSNNAIKLCMVSGLQSITINIIKLLFQEFWIYIFGYPTMRIGQNISRLAQIEAISEIRSLSKQHRGYFL